jgi:hypothetical protein
MSFDFDGLFTGYTGCMYQNTFVASFQSSEENHAAEISPELCPLGKYGYDPRCRDWYATGKSKYESSRIPVHITAPYPFATENEIATSATSPVVNPTTGEYAGQALLDFNPSAIRRMLERMDGLAFLITPDVTDGGDTVVGPDKSAGWESAQIGELLFPRGDASREHFEKVVLPKLKKGERGLEKITRATEDGNLETLSLAFEPVQARVLLPVSPDDFSRGVAASDVLVYSLGIASQDDSIRQPWGDVEDDVHDDLRRIQVIYIAIVVAVSFLFVIMTCNVRCSHLAR